MDSGCFNKIPKKSTVESNKSCERHTSHFTVEYYFYSNCAYMVIQTIHVKNSETACDFYWFLVENYVDVDVYSSWK